MMRRVPALPPSAALEPIERASEDELRALQLTRLKQTLAARLRARRVPTG